MFYRCELQFLRDVFEKCRVPSFVVSPDDRIKRVLDKAVNPIFYMSLPDDATFSSFLADIDMNTVYKLRDSCCLSYIYLKLPDMADEALLFIGPYMSSHLTKKQIFEIGEKNGIEPKYHRSFERCLSDVAVVMDDSPLFSMLNAFFERIWGSADFALVDIDRENDLPASPINDRFDDVLIDMNIMEKRYRYENELMEAVASGQLHKVNQFLSVFSEDAFEKRTKEPLRNLKNYCIIMNTLLRKAAENGGVHPIYLDRVSSDFAGSIERNSDISEVKNLMWDMFRTYCRLVRKHSIKSYSPIVQKVIIKIDSDISADLTLGELAKFHRVSSGYLSTIFKKETGKSITEYIRERRIKHATHLLATTSLQIQTIALHCGIMDVQYFTKLFKRTVGKSPTEYREMINQ